MKMIYESPMVELTVFDTEDIMTASVRSTTVEENAAALSADVLAEEYTSKNTRAKFGKYSGGSYTWR